MNRKDWIDNLWLFYSCCVKTCSLIVLGCTIILMFRVSLIFIIIASFAGGTYYYTDYEIREKEHE